MSLAGRHSLPARALASVIGRDRRRRAVEVRDIAFRDGWTSARASCDRWRGGLRFSQQLLVSGAWQETVHALGPGSVRHAGRRLERPARGTVVESLDFSREVNRHLSLLGWQVTGRTQVLCMDLAEADRLILNPEGVSVSEAYGKDARRLASSTMLAGYEYGEEHREVVLRTRCEHSSRRERLFLASIGCDPVAAASLWVHRRSAYLSGCATLRAHRRCGAQQALIRARLVAAASMGCDMLHVTSAPGSGSQRNLERFGFKPVFALLRWGSAATSRRLTPGG